MFGLSANATHPLYFISPFSFAERARFKASHVGQASVPDGINVWRRFFVRHSLSYESSEVLLGSS